MTPDRSARRWVVYACRSPYAAEVAEVIWRRGEEVAVLVDNLGEGSGAAVPHLAVPTPVIGPGELTTGHLALDFVVPLITPGHRHTVLAEARAAGATRFPALVDPMSVVARSAEIGEASVVNTSATVGANTRLGHAVHVNRGASLGHDVIVEDFASIGPAAALAGHVHVGRGAIVGVGAVCAPGVRIGPNAVVGAGAVVVREVAPGAVVVGNPARVLRTADTGYGGVAVP